MPNCILTAQFGSSLECTAEMPSGDIGVLYFLTMTSYTLNGVENDKATPIRVLNGEKIVNN